MAAVAGVRAASTTSTVTQVEQRSPARADEMTWFSGAREMSTSVVPEAKVEELSES